MLSVQELLPIEAYEKERDAHRRRVMALKDRRRVSIGPNVTLLFENKETLWYQIQEIIRSEKLTRPEDLAMEVNVYTPLLPEKGVLSACLFIEVTQQEQIRPVMDSMVGLNTPGRVNICFGSHVIGAEFEEGRSTDSRISAVQYVKFRFSPQAMTDLAGAADVRLAVTHPGYEHEAPVNDALRAEWLRDLMGA